MGAWLGIDGSLTGQGLLPGQRAAALGHPALDNEPLVKPESQQSTRIDDGMRPACSQGDRRPRHRASRRTYQRAFRIPADHPAQDRPGGRADTDLQRRPAGAGVLFLRERASVMVASIG